MSVGTIVRVVPCVCVIVSMLLSIAHGDVRDVTGAARTRYERIAQAGTPTTPAQPSSPPRPAAPAPVPAGTPTPDVQSGVSSGQTPTAAPQATNNGPDRPAPPAPTTRARLTPRSSMQLLPGGLGPGGQVQMQFDNIELRDLIRFVSSIMGVNFVYDEAMMRGRVTILSPKTLKREEVFRVFESVLGYYGFNIVATPEVHKIVRSADAKGSAVQTLDGANFMGSPAEERISTLVCPLVYLDSNTMVPILRPLMSRDAYLASVASANALIMIDTAANLQRLKALIAQVDLPVSRQLSSIEVYNVQHTNAADLAKSLQGFLAEGKKAQTPKEKIFITAYAATNSLLISAPAEDMREIRRIIGEIDTFRPQVLVEAAIVELSLDKTETLGVEWLTGGRAEGTRIIGGNVIGTDPTTATLVPLTSALASGNAASAVASMKSGLNIGVVGSSITFGGVTFPSVQAFVNALAADKRANILSTPQLLTMNNEEAEVLVGSNTPYTTSTRLDASGNPITNFDYRDVGVKLKVKPYINKDRLVYMNIFAEVTQVTSTLATVGSGSQTAPTTLKRSTKTTVGAKDAETIVISGLIQDNSSHTDQGVPFLKSIPLFGKLFSYTNRTSNKINLLVFLTPRIVYDAETLKKISDEKRAEQEKLVAPNRRKQ